MPKPYTLPTLYNEVKTINISFLKKHGYFTPHQTRSGVITWSRNEEKTGSISVSVHNEIDNTYLELDYKFNGEPVKYRVYIVTIKSNLGKGEIPLFVCPITQIQCRKLYQVHKYFYHRKAFKGCMYESQTYSHKDRALIRMYEMYFNTDLSYNQLYKKHFKKCYAGKPTKKYLKLKTKLDRAEQMYSTPYERAQGLNELLMK
jgi:hypothetical protein